MELSLSSDRNADIALPSRKLRLLALPGGRNNNDFDTSLWMGIGSLVREANVDSSFLDLSFDRTVPIRAIKVIVSLS